VGCKAPSIQVASNLRVTQSVGETLKFDFGADFPWGLGDNLSWCATHSGTGVRQRRGRGPSLAWGSASCLLFHSTQSANLTPLPPKQSRALPIVRSTLPLLKAFTLSRSSNDLLPPA
jgi:hypothetical protein